MRIVAAMQLAVLNFMDEVSNEKDVSTSREGFVLGSS